MTTWSTLDGRPTRIIAHRGASGLRPEHTQAAYELAREQGADVVEPDLVVSRDGVLIVRHDRGLRRSTDVALRPEFAPRCRDDDWPVDGFTRAELRTLRAIQPTRDRDTTHDRQYPLLDFGDVLAWADTLARLDGEPVVLYPELKHPALFASIGLDPVPRMIEALHDVDPAQVEVWLQCFELEPLLRLREATGRPSFLLLEEDVDAAATLEAVATRVDGLALSKRALRPALVERAHALGLQVHAWTYRDDRVGAGFARIDDELALAFTLGVDAVFCDYPATGLACRARHAQA